MGIIPRARVRIYARTDADLFFEVRRRTTYADQGGVPVNVSAYSFAFTAKANATDLEPLFEATTGNGGITFIDAPGGRIWIFVDKAALAGAMPSGVAQATLQHALKAAGPGGADEVWRAGELILTRGL